MKIIVLVISSALSFLMFNLSLMAQTMDIISYNIRYNNPNDGDDQWEERKQDVVHFFTTYQPTAFGVQEATHEQMEYLKNELTGYSEIGVGRDDGETKGEYSAIFYQKDALEVITEGTFWLSPTPEKVSKGWDAALPRIYTYAQFKHKETDKTFWHFNTHFDHRGAKAREESAKVILKEIEALTHDNEPLVVTGDFNATPDAPPIQIMSEDLTDPSALKGIILDGTIGTFSGFELQAPLKNRIDYIFVRGLKVEKYAHMNDKRPNGRWISDHLPVKITVLFE